MSICLVSIATAGWYVAQAKEQGEIYDNIGCRTDNTPDHLVILLDRSDALLPLQKTDALQRIESAIANTASGTRTSLWMLDPGSPGIVTNVFDGCQPRNGRHANALIENERRLRARWRNEFIDPLYQTLHESLNDQPADRSPLLEAVQRIGVVAFNVERDDLAERRLLILSDLLHHTDQYSHYHNSCDYDAFKSSTYAKTLDAPLEAIDVDVLYVGRPGMDRFQTNCHGMFWERYLSENHARLRSIHRLAGG